jgi:phage terminase small subunit
VVRHPRLKTLVLLLIGAPGRGLCCPKKIEKPSVILGGQKKKGGVFVRGAVKIADLENQLLTRIDKEDLIEVDKVKRYIAIVKQIRKLQTAINKEGVMSTTVNANQEFVKTNPAINELNKLTKTLISLEKSIKFSMAYEKVMTKDDQKDNDEPKVSELY